MRKSLERQIRRRAGDACEYCRLPAEVQPAEFEIDHIIPRQHGGRSTHDNLAFSCLRCNRHKGPNLSGIDPESGAVVTLFHPRREIWTEHFVWDGPVLRGRTATGRATVMVLDINHPDRMALRETLIASGEFLRET